IDPALELAGELARITGLPLLPVLRAPLWGRVRAGHAHGFAPRFRLHRSPGPVPVTLVDDVITTGSTLVAAARCLPGTTSAVTATTSARVGVGAKGPTPEGTSLPDAGLHME
ncbi:MAG: hypothetical protein ACLFWM_05490, partial [Actinomycetota bacterium]